MVLRKYVKKHRRNTGTKRLHTKETQDGITEHGEFISKCGSENFSSK